MKDLHIHIEQGPYTVEWIEKFISQAEKMGIDEICLLEHSIRFKDFRPCFNDVYNYNKYQKNWVAEKEKTMQNLSDFKALISEIREKHYPIKVKFGLEICYFSQYEKEISNLVSDGFFDLLFGSVHWVDNWTINQRKYQWLGKDVDKIYKRYFEIEKQLINSKLFDIVAHPDLIRCQNIFPDYDLKATYLEICDLAMKKNIALEMNTSRNWKDPKCELGLTEEFFKIAKEKGVKLTTGSDAHRPEDVGKGIKDAEILMKS